MKEIINGKYFKWFRKSFLKRIYNDILSNKEQFCCHVNSWHSNFICWKELKEVSENTDSEYLHPDIRANKRMQNCDNCWFVAKLYRLGFLEECLNKF